VKKRSRHPILRAVGVIVVLLLACLVFVVVRSGSSGNSTGSAGTGQGGAKGPTTAPATGPNQPVGVKNWEITVTSIERPGKDLTWSEFGNKSTAAGTWMIVVVKMRNTGTTNFGVNNPDFELRAAGGIKYNVSSDAGTSTYSEFKGGQSVGGQVPPGVEVTYHIPFDVAPDASGLQFVFKQDKNPVFTIGDATQ